MDFYSFRDEYSEAKRQGAMDALLFAHTHRHFQTLPTPVEFYEILAQSVLGRSHTRQYGDSAITQHILSNGLKLWNMRGQPYVKVWPQIASKLMHTKLDVPVGYLNIPYGVFSVRLPKENNPFQTADTPALRSIVVIHCEGTYSLSGAEARQLLIWFDLGSHDLESIPFRQKNGQVRLVRYEQPTYGYLHLRMEDDLTLQDSVDRTEAVNFANESHHEVVAPSRDFYQAALALAMCTCFFMTNSHDLVCPDIPLKYREKYAKAKAEGDQKTLDEIQRKARRGGMGGYTLGREIELPRPISVPHEGGESPQNGQTWSQRFSHVRSGHLRLQAHGPKLSQRKVIFIEPTVVKPHLPPKPCVGYAIKDNILPKGEQ